MIEFDTASLNDRATLNARHCTPLPAFAHDGDQRIFELMGVLDADLTQLAQAPMRLRLSRIDYQPHASAYEFLSARWLDATVPH